MAILLKSLDFALKWLLPFSVASAIFLVITSKLEESYRKANQDLFWKKIIKWLLILGIISLIIAFVIHTKAYNSASNTTSAIVEKIKTLPVLGVMATYLQLAHVWVSQMWAYWTLFYGRAFAFVFVIGIPVEIYALIWRISFWRAFNVIWPIVVEYPYLMFKYFQGYQTPVQDKVLAGILKAKLRENLNDSYEGIDRGVDANGKPFEDGAGGSVQAQTRSAVNQAMKRVRVSVRTTTDGQRIAHVLIRQSRETETDHAIEQVLKGWGERVSGNGIYFPADPTYSVEEKGYIFDSTANFGADEELGSYKSNFPNPMDEENKVSNGGDGAISTFITAVKNSVDYFIHLTPYAMYLRHKRMVDLRYYRDTTADKAKFRVQQNLDLSVIREPRDSKGRTIEELKDLAMKKAKMRIPDVTTALSGFGLYGQFKNVKVGGNTAIYEFTLPPDAKLPNDFDKVQDQIGNILRINEKPIITLRAGILSVSLDNGVNIPVSFTDMIKKRSKGASTIISGLIGEDALGTPLTIELGDSMPHCIIFGKTGTGKSVLILSMLFSIMSGTDPTHLKILYIDGKGNSFEFMKADGEHPNPFTFTQPADASGDMDYARALIIWLEKECRRRIELFKQASVQKLADYNKKMKKEGKKILPELLAVIDEFSAITQQDKQLAAKDIAKLNVVDRFEYLAKMARSVGIRMVLANQSARKELVPGKISANIPGRISLGVAEPIEAEIALPETGIKVNLISQPGEFYSLMHGATNPEHGNGPYIPTDEMNLLNDGLTKKFGKCKYVKTREQIFKEAGLEDKMNQSNPNADNSPAEESNSETGSKDANYTQDGKQIVKASEVKRPTGKVPTNETGFGFINIRVNKDLNYALYVKAHEADLIDHNAAMYTHNDTMKKSAEEKANRIRVAINHILEENNIEFIDDLGINKAHPHQGELTQYVHGNDKVI